MDAVGLPGIVLSGVGHTRPVSWTFPHIYSVFLGFHQLCIPLNTKLSVLESDEQLSLYVDSWLSGIPVVRPSFPVTRADMDTSRMRSDNVPYEGHDKRVGILVIAYNAESHIQETLDRIPEEIWQAISVVYVIDDCSTDETVEKALSFQKHQNKFVVLRNRVNRMYGGNQKLGYQYAIENNLDVVVMLHADGQYAPEQLEQILAPIVRGDADVVIGSRMLKRKDALKGRMPYYKFFGNIILTKIQNLLCKMDLSEFHSGYRAYSTSFLKNILFFENTDSWHFDTEILLQAKEYGCKILEVPIPTYYGSEICRVNGIWYAFNCILTSWKYYLFRKKLLYCRTFDVNPRDRRYTEKFNDPFSSHSKIINILQLSDLKGKKVLEMGVGDASLTKKMVQMGAIIDAIEIDSVACESARPHCRVVYEGALENIERINISDQYDLIVMADVLEHLMNPEYVLSKAKTYLKTGGALIVSLPNVANIYVRLNVLLGRFPYHSKGILDRTHLHFYTLRTAENLLIRTGWVIVGKDVTSIPIGIIFPFLQRGPLRFALHLLYRVTKMWKRLFAYEFIFRCVNPNRSSLL